MGDGPVLLVAISLLACASISARRDQSSGTTMAPARSFIRSTAA
jgi:hypothetical protein